ncbi:MAG: HAAS signaling domain-containing protein, partial [Candidatus Thorarchaeota archaeon]
MAKLEQPDNAADKRGGVEMTDNPEIVIEEYLALVNEHLPESIAEDVINELRSYMIETASETGGGAITHQSAKKVVAKFGAPSEVAREYKYSMLPETIPPEDEAQIVQADEIEEPESHKKEVITYSAAFLQTGVIAIAWILVITLLSTILGPI